MENILNPKLRKIFKSDELLPYNRYGSANPDLEWKPLSSDPNTNYECFFVRFKPRSKSIPHEHSGGEEFYVIEGSLTDCDGTVYQTGDFISFEPGSRHMSYSEDGCLLLTILHGKNLKIDSG